MKSRKLLVTLHLLFAGLLAPAFIMIAWSGAQYLLGNKGQLDTSAVSLPAGATLDFGSETLEDDVRTLLDRAQIDYDFDYIKNRGSKIELRPTSKIYYAFETKNGQLSATKNDPDLLKSMVELHKGHGPYLYKLYQILCAFALMGIVFGGIAVGLMAKAYRRKTVGSVVIGTVVFFVLVLVG